MISKFSLAIISVSALVFFLFCFLNFFEAYKVHILKNVASIFIICAYKGEASLTASFGLLSGIWLFFNIRNLYQKTTRQKHATKKRNGHEKYLCSNRMRSLQNTTFTQIVIVFLCAYCAVGLSSTYVEVYKDKFIYFNGFSGKMISYPYSSVVKVEIDCIRRPKAIEKEYILTMTDGRRLNIAAETVQAEVLYHIERNLFNHVPRICKTGGKKGVIDKMPQQYRAYFYEKYLGRSEIF